MKSRSVEHLGQNCDMAGILPPRLPNVGDVGDFGLEQRDRARQLDVGFAYSDGISRVAQLFVGHAMHMAEHFNEERKAVVIFGDDNPDFIG